MQARRSFLVLLFSALLLLASPAFSAGGSAPSGEEVSPRCEAAIDKAAGRYSQCLLKASARHAKKGKKARLSAQQTRCDNKFDTRVARIQDRFGEDECTSYVSEIADRTATCAEEVSIEAGGEAASSRLYVQNADGGTLTETTLTLTGVSLQTGWFTDRPYRDAGRMTTAAFVVLFSEERANSFAENPPNADFTCESGGEVVNKVLTLTEPVLDEATDTLTYTAVLVSSGHNDDYVAEVTCDADAHLFIDSSFDPRDGLPGGSWSQSCDIVSWDGYRLCANCATMESPSDTSYSCQSCPENYVNSGGALTCKNADSQLSCSEASRYFQACNADFSDRYKQECSTCTGPCSMYVGNGDSQLSCSEASRYFQACNADFLDRYNRDCSRCTGPCSMNLGY